ncbi:hypothetical protein BKA93DRAFT_796725 [Sparassis latifolia]
MPLELQLTRCLGLHRGTYSDLPWHNVWLTDTMHIQMLLSWALQLRNHLSKLR